MDGQLETESSKKWLTWVIVVIIVLVAGIAIYYGTRSKDSSDNNQPADNNPVILTETNHLVVGDQLPGKSVYVSVQIASPGFVVVRRQTTSTTTLGTVLGTLYVDASVAQPGTITLAQATVNGTNYDVGLFIDTNGNQRYDIGIDMPALDSRGQEVKASFKATTDLPDMKG